MAERGHHPPEPEAQHDKDAPEQEPSTMQRFLQAWRERSEANEALRHAATEQQLISSHDLDLYDTYAGEGDRTIVARDESGRRMLRRPTPQEQATYEAGLSRQKREALGAFAAASPLEQWRHRRGLERRDQERADESASIMADERRKQRLGLAEQTPLSDPARPPMQQDGDKLRYVLGVNDQLIDRRSNALRKFLSRQAEPPRDDPGRSR